MECGCTNAGSWRRLAEVSGLGSQYVSGAAGTNVSGGSTLAGISFDLTLGISLLLLGCCSSVFLTGIIQYIIALDLLSNRSTTLKARVGELHRIMAGKNDIPAPVVMEMLPTWPPKQPDGTRDGSSKAHRRPSSSFSTSCLVSPHFSYCRSDPLVAAYYGSIFDT
jgi:hypothetical protein